VRLRRDCLLDGLVAHHTCPALSLDDRPTSGVIEEKVSAEVTSTANTGDAVPLVGEEMLKQNLELGTGHGIDCRHARSPVCLTLAGATPAEERHHSNEQHNDAQQSQAATPGVPGNGAEDEQSKACKRNSSNWVLAQEGAAGGNAPTLWSGCSRCR
jgi:hypothetical protein